MVTLTTENIEPWLYNTLFRTSKTSIELKHPRFLYRTPYVPLLLMRLIRSLEGVIHQIIELSSSISREDLEYNKADINRILYNLEILSFYLSTLITNIENLHSRSKWFEIISRSSLFRLKNCQENIVQILENFLVAFDPEMTQKIDQRLTHALQQFS